MIVVLMGVSGSGKTTVGSIHATSLGWRFIEGDEYHPLENVTKMSRGEPLTDDDRSPWLDRLHEIFSDLTEQARSAVVACSALKQLYRYRLAEDIPDIRFVYLRGDRELIADRLCERTDHYMPVSLLDSQFDALEEPDDDTVIVDIDVAPEQVAALIAQKLGR